MSLRNKHLLLNFSLLPPDRYRRSFTTVWHATVFKSNKCEHEIMPQALKPRADERERHSIRVDYILDKFLQISTIASIVENGGGLKPDHIMG